ncbi:MAG: hypothetical protein PF569_09110 [Candidatus Woesearchaeota archaeon]|nr:hypothetical protein [Candidatus Woesearchaeota archaeon]
MTSNISVQCVICRTNYYFVTGKLFEGEHFICCGCLERAKDIVVSAVSNN